MVATLQFRLTTATKLLLSSKGSHSTHCFKMNMHCTCVKTSFVLQQVGEQRAAVGFTFTSITVSNRVLHV